MAYCTNCGKEIRKDFYLCPYCGAKQTFATAAQNSIRSDADAVVNALQEIFNHFGAQQTLGNTTLFCNAVSDKLGDDGKKLKLQIRIAMDAGLGKLYLKQLQKPMPDFDKQCLTLLTQEAGLSDDTAQQLRDLFHGMVGFSIPQARPARPAPAPVEVQRSTQPAKKAEISQFTVSTETLSGGAQEQKRSPARLLLIVAVLLAAGYLLYPVIMQDAVWPQMMSDYLPSDGSIYYVLGSRIPRAKVGSIWFGSSLADAPADAWDVSAQKNGSVKAWVTIGTGGAYDMYIAGNGGVRLPANCAQLFSEYTRLREIHFGTCVSSDDVTDMEKMFANCSSLSTLDLSGFNTAHVTNMSDMFYGCSGLTSLNLSGFNTAEVTDMSSMFDSCISLASLDLSSFNTEKVIRMSDMFWECERLSSLNLTSFNTEKVTAMGFMFYGCSNLQSIRVSRQFVVPSNENAIDMFANCPAGRLTYQ